MKKTQSQMFCRESMKDRHLGPASTTTQDKRIDLDKSLFERALKKVPTGGNSQPFKWQWKDETLEVEHMPEFAKHYLNRNNHTSWIALGCLIYSVEVVAEATGLKVETDISIDTLHTKISFSKTNAPSIKTEMPALLKRSTYREGFVRSLSPVKGVLAQIANSKVQVHVADSYILTEEFKGYLQEASNYLWLQSRATIDFFKEIRFFSPLSNQEARGIRSQDLGAKTVDEFMLFVFSVMPRVLSYLIRRTPMRWIFNSNTKRSVLNAHYVLVTAQKLDSMSLLDVGRQAMKSWLQLEDLGFGVQPYSIASIPVVDAEMEVLPADTDQHFRKLFGETGPQVMKHQFRLHADEKPVWLFRVGRKEWKP